MSNDFMYMGDGCPKCQGYGYSICRCNKSEGPMSDPIRESFEAWHTKQYGYYSDSDLVRQRLVTWQAALAWREREDATRTQETMERVSREALQMTTCRIESDPNMKAINETLPESVIKQAVAKGVKIASTLLDQMSDSFHQGERP